ncbi:Chromatin modification-related protein EAF1 A [Glycine soja]|uniref:Chromatin modification-related protein EAF1 A n=1 Tax=Glycine soja TaxID=3848 RepID=A0A445GGE7_GLYSO|nr:Chromatin modification-related protein EAF1 A [Glycine soja]
MPISPCRCISWDRAHKTPSRPEEVQQGPGVSSSGYGPLLVLQGARSPSEESHPQRHSVDLEKSNRALGFPALVTGLCSPTGCPFPPARSRHHDIGLCQFYGVPVAPSKIIRPPTNRAFIKKYCVPRQAQGETPQQPGDGRQRATDTPPSPLEFTLAHPQKGSRVQNRVMEQLWFGNRMKHLPVKKRREGVETRVVIMERAGRTKSVSIFAFLLSPIRGPLGPSRFFLQKAVASGGSNLARLGELGGKLLPYFAINRGWNEGRRGLAFLALRILLNLLRKIVSVKKIQAEALPRVEHFCPALLPLFIGKKGGACHPAHPGELSSPRRARLLPPEGGTAFWWNSWKTQTSFEAQDFVLLLFLSLHSSSPTFKLLSMASYGEAKDFNDEEDSWSTSSTWSYITGYVNRWIIFKFWLEGDLDTYCLVFLSESVVWTRLGYFLGDGTTLHLRVEVSGVYFSFLVGAGTRMVAPLVVELGDYEIENDPKMLKEDSKTKEDLKMLEKDPKEEGKVFWCSFYTRREKALKRPLGALTLCLGSQLRHPFVDSGYVWIGGRGWSGEAWSGKGSCSIVWLGMNGYKSGSALLVNAEVDSMGGVVDGGIGIGLKISPRRAAIEKAQAELREEYDVREERRRELEFLEKGGNPLDFKSGNAASVSVQSTSLTDQLHEQFVTSEAKGSFALTASPHGDSVDSSARPGAPLASEPNTADNLLLFDGENELPETERRCLHSNRRNNIALSEQSSQIDGSQNAKETEDSAIFRPYARRNRSRSGHGPRGASREVKGLTSETNSQKNLNLSTVSKPKPSCLNGDVGPKYLTTNNTLNNELVGIRDHQSTSGNASVPEDKLDITVNRNLKENHGTLPSEDNTVQDPVLMASGEDNIVELREPVAVVNHEPPPHVPTTKPENGPYCQPNGFGNVEVDRKSVLNEGQNSIATLGKNFNLESSCTKTSLVRDVNIDSDMCTNTKNVDANGNTMEQTFALENKLNFAGCKVVKDRHKTKNANGATVSNEHDAGYQNHSGCGNIVKAEEDVHIKSSCMSNVKGVPHNDSNISKVDKDTILVDQSNFVKENSCERHQVPVDVSLSEPPKTAPDVKGTSAASDDQPCPMHNMKLADKAHEDSILEEAKIIEAKRKRIAELSLHSLSTQNHRKSHWGFVLEEMAWLANDFAQERLWKIAAAAQLGHQTAFTCRSRFEKLNRQLETKILSHRIAKAVMQFWHSAKLLLDNDLGINCIVGCVESGKVDANEALRDQRRNSNMETSKFLEGQNPEKHAALKVHAYALRFLKANRSHGISSQAEAPTTPEKIFDSSTVDMSWDEHLNEENLFYEVPPTAMETYRKAIESHFLQFEKTGSSIQEEVATSVYDTAAEFGSQENAYDEEEGETRTYYLPSVYEGNRSSKSAQKKHKNLKAYTPRFGDAGADFPYVHYATGNQPSMLFEKRPASLNVGSIPTKRMRTATRHRVVSPFTVNIGTVQAQAKADASSGDTNSFHDDQSTLHVGPLIQKSTEVESVADYEKQLSHDCAETFVKTKKKKKAKTLGTTYDQGWQLDSVVLNEQRDQSKKRGESHHFESNGSSGKTTCFCGQPNSKKPKIMRQSLDNPLDNIVSMTNSIPSPVASQMSNMSNPNKFIKIISGRDRGRKAKALKISAGQPGSGSPWSLFEDQALVVLVHDMGPNWELISDAINSALQIKCVFRKPKECKERHKNLMDRTTGDGADSAEDSGSSHSYPSTLPGIPKACLGSSSSMDSFASWNMNGSGMEKGREREETPLQEEDESRRSSPP